MSLVASLILLLCMIDENVAATAATWSLGPVRSWTNNLSKTPLGPQCKLYTTCIVSTSQCATYKASIYLQYLAFILYKYWQRGNLSVTNFFSFDRLEVVFSLHFYNVNSWFERLMSVQSIFVIMSGIYDSLADRACSLMKLNMHVVSLPNKLLFIHLSSWVH